MEMAVLGFVVAGPLNAVACSLGGNIALSNLLVWPPPAGRPWIGVYSGSHRRFILP
jgi:hypothetical protein